MPPHFVLTRIGLGCFNDDWYRHAIDIFDAITFSSLAGQASQDFHFLIVADKAMQGDARAHLQDIVAANGNFHVVDIDVTALTSMHLGGHDWIYQPCRRYILANGLIEDPSDYVVTSVIDADDAWHRDFAATVSAIARDNMDKVLAREEAQTNSHVRHSAGFGLTFPQGLKWFPHSGHAEPLPFRFPSASVSVMARFSSGVSAFSCRHAAWADLLSILMFETIEMQTAEPMWLHVRHSQTTQPWDYRHYDERQLFDGSEIERMFGVDPGKTAKAFAGYDPSTRVYAGKPARHQYDRLFQLSALNAQIECLEQSLAAPSSPSQAETLPHLLARQREKRQRLLDLIRSAGQTEYS